MRCGVLAAAILLAATAAARAQDGSEEIDVARELSNIRGTLEQTRELETQIETTRREWRIGKEMLQERIDVVQREIDSLEEDISAMRSDITETDKNREKLVEENERLKNTAAALRETVSRYESRVKTLVSVLPPPAAELIRPLSQRVPANAEETEVSLANRYQNVIGILNELDKFNQKVSVSSQTREVAPGDSREVDTLYIGLGAGYYAGPEGRVGGRGYAAAEGWQWSAENDAASQIVEAIRIFNNEKTATFIPLPLEIKIPTRSGEEEVAASAASTGSTGSTESTGSTGSTGSTESTDETDAAASTPDAASGTAAQPSMKSESDSAANE